MFMPTKQDLSEIIFDDNEAIELIDSLMFELVGNVNKDELAKLLTKLKQKADDAYKKLDGTLEAEAKQAAFEHQDYVNSVMYAASL